MSNNTHQVPTHCLNCGAELKGRYCYQCGQDSVDHVDSVWHLVKHFFEDITHYDGKLFGTIKPLLTKPGFITQQFLTGKRASYLNPVRMFIFLNFIFFFLILSLPSVSSRNFEAISEDKAEHDSVTRELHNAGVDIKKEIKLDKNITISSAIGYDSVSQYDSAQSALPPTERDGRIRRTLTRRWIPMLQSMKKDPQSAKEKLKEVFLHNLPKLTFLFIIVCSCLLYLLYYRRHIFLVNHALFSIHLACTFLLLSIVMLALSYLPWGGYLELIVFLYGSYYFFRALHAVYGQSFLKTATKFVIISFSLFIIMCFGLLFNLLFALMSIGG